MRLVLRLLALMVVVQQVTGLTWAIGEDACSSDCEDDDEGEDCPPSCPSCACSARSTPSVVPKVVQWMVPPAAELVEFVEVQVAVPSPEPREILHVPIARLV